MMMPLFYLASLLLLGCANQINENDLYGNWKVTKFEANTPELSPSLIEGAKTEALSTTYLFNKDNSFSMKSDFVSDGSAGTYEFITETHSLQMTSSSQNDNSIEEYTVESLSGNSMKWSHDMGELGNLKLVLTKE